MSRVRTLFASLALTSTLLACSVPHADARSARPVPVAPIKIKPSSQDALRVHVKKALTERRKLTIERFLAYREARVYPINSKVPGAGHVWLDELGNLCAAATIIAQDWGRAASEAVARENNNIALASVTEGELYNWILTSGLTKAEIVSIQVPGWQGGGEELFRSQEVQRLYTLYLDVERQIRSLDKHNLELAVDALMKHPELARDLIAGKTASAGHFGVKVVDPVGFEPSMIDGATVAPATGFAQPPRG